MLWSDPKDEPPQELRDMEVMLRRAGVLLALVMIIGMIIVGLR
ncbi:MULTISPECIES: morphogenic membrane protein MmpB [unclassified Streptomyces]